MLLTFLLASQNHVFRISSDASNKLSPNPPTALPLLPLQTPKVSLNDLSLSPLFFPAVLVCWAVTSFHFGTSLTSGLSASETESKVNQCSLHFKTVAHSRLSFNLKPLLIDLYEKFDSQIFS